MRNFITISILGGLLLACGNKQDAPQQRPPQEYKVLQIQKQSSTLVAEYPAKLEGITDIDIRPKIDGYVDQIFVYEGQEVKKGQLLMKISNPQYAQDVQGLAAAVASAESAVATAELQVEKTKPLVNKGIISAFELRNVELALQARQADLLRAKAQYNNALTNVGYTSVKAPSDGVIGTLPYKVGSYVNSATAQPLTRVSDIRTVYAYFSVNEKQQLDIVMNTEGASFQDKIAKIPSVSLLMSNGTKFEKEGKIETFSGLANVQTGSFNVRASFPNPNKILRSGGSAIVQIPTYIADAIVIPQKATMELQDKRMAYILEKDNKVKAVPIVVRAVPGGEFFVVDEGLSTDDLILLEGVGIIADGTEVVPVKTTLEDLKKEAAPKK